MKNSVGKFACYVIPLLSYACCIMLYSLSSSIFNVKTAFVLLLAVEQGITWFKMFLELSFWLPLIVEEDIFVPSSDLLILIKNYCWFLHKGQ